MKRWLVAGCLAITLAVLGYGRGKPTQQQPASSSQPNVSAAINQRALLDQYCVGCHNATTKSAGLTLDKMDVTRIGENAQIWEKVVRKLRSGMMPPAGARRPEPAAYEALTAWLETELDRTSQPNLHKTTLHRLNRNEYENAIRDLLALEVDATTFLPVDDSTYGFDNIADSLAISPALLEAYVAAAGKISRLAVGHDNTVGQKTYSVLSDYTQNYQVEGLPFGSRGGLLIHHHFSADGEYNIHILLVRETGGHRVGAGTLGEKLEVSIDGERVGLFDIDKVIETGDAFEDKYLSLTLPVKAGTHSVGVTFIATNYKPTRDVFEPLLRSTILGGDEAEGTTYYPHVGSVKISGPYNGTGAENTASRKEIFTCRPEAASQELGCARKILSTLVRRAYRRPASAEDLEVMMEFYESGRKKGDFEQGIEMALRRILASPQFLFRSEHEPANVAFGETYRITDVELASRLSFFLWSSIPDDELVDLANAGKLRDPVVLDQQVRRMLADPRSRELVANFAGQWLNLRNLPASVPAAMAFPEFDDNLRQAFRRETELLFESIMREDRSIIDLLSADYTFVNERLARHYGIPNIYGPHFRRITLGSEYDVRHGLLGKGAILTVTSLADRTSPVLRGRWVLENILGTVAPDPPPNVPELKESPNGQTTTVEDRSLRRRMEQHRANPACASCHKIMDPFGFSLENFDAVGKWRTKDGGVPVNAADQLVDGTRIEGPSGLRKALLRYSPQFARTVSERLLTYALGRGVEYSDMPTVRSIVREGSRNNYRFSSIVLNIVKSAPFQMNMKVRESAARE